MNKAEKAAAEYMIESTARSEVTTKELEKIYKSTSDYTMRQVKNLINRTAGKGIVSETKAAELLKKLKDPGDIPALIRELKKVGINPEDLKRIERELGRFGVLDMRIMQRIEQLSGITTAGTTRLLEGILPETYLHTVYETALESGLALYASPPPASQIKRLIENPFLGRTIYEKVLERNKLLRENIKKEIITSVLTGRSNYKTAQEISHRYRVGLYDARRIIRTEMTAAQGEMRLQAYEDYDVEKYVYVAVLDLRTSEQCRELDGNIYPVDKAEQGWNYPPMHPWCRSTTISFVDEETLKRLKRKARNPITGEIQELKPGMNYKEWYIEYVVPEMEKAGIDPAQKRREKAR